MSLVPVRPVDDPLNDGEPYCYCGHAWNVHAETDDSPCVWPQCICSNFRPSLEVSQFVLDGVEAVEHAARIFRAVIADGADRPYYGEICGWLAVFDAGSGEPS